MKIKVSKTLGKGVKVEFVYSDVKSTNKKIEELKKSKVFKADKGEVLFDLLSDDSVLYLGLGDSKELTIEDLREVFFKLGKTLHSNKVSNAGVVVEKFGDLCLVGANKAIVEGLLQSEYSFDKFLSEKKFEPSVKEFTIVVKEKEKEVKEAVKEIEILMKGVFLARDLVNEPAMYMTPTELANQAVTNLEPLGVKVKVLGQKEIEKLGMKAFLAVSKGSEQEPKFIIMEWNGDADSKEKIALVGKGLTYDSGGYCIKTPSGMVDMHGDMAGAASVIGAMMAIAENKVKKNVVAVVAACENMISGGAYKTGDIIGSMAGKSIFIGSTDAEGRLTLADALYYVATKVKPDKIIDVATLTGAVVVALGSITTGLVSNNDTFAKEFIESGEKVGEPVWQLPLTDKYRKAVKGTVSDLLNSTKVGAGSITAGAFLEYFVEKTPWVHLDIAGTSHLSKADGYLPIGATGVPVKSLYHYVKCK